MLRKQTNRKSIANPHRGQTGNHTKSKSILPGIIEKIPIITARNKEESDYKEEHVSSIK